MDKRFLIIAFIFLCLGILVLAAFTLFFDQAILVRKGTVYKANTDAKVVALTFDDGPSLQWTPRVLEALKKAEIKATFFMLGEHVAKYPDIARAVADGGHEIENHSYNHHIIINDTSGKLTNDIKKTETIIRETTGVTTRYFRPPKAWVTQTEKNSLREMGYTIVLWTLNSKDWVTFDDKYIVNYLVRNIRPGDIILFHDSGGILGAEGGNRDETVKTIPRLAEKLRKKGYSFVTVRELLENKLP